MMTYCPGVAMMTYCPGVATMTYCPGVATMTYCPGGSYDDLQSWARDIMSLHYSSTHVCCTCDEWTNRCIYVIELKNLVTNYYKLTLFCVFNNNYIHSYNFSSRIHFYMIRMQMQQAAIWYENQLHRGKQTNAMRLYVCHVSNKTYWRKSIDLFLKQRDSNHFPVNIGVCAAFPSRRASRNSSIGLEEMLLDGVAIESAIADFVHFCLLDL